MDPVDADSGTTVLALTVSGNSPSPVRRMGYAGVIMGVENAMHASGLPGYHNFVRGRMDCSLLKGKFDGEIPCKCNDCAKDCQRDYEDNEIFQCV